MTSTLTTRDVMSFVSNVLRLCKRCSCVIAILPLETHEWFDTESETCFEFIRQTLARSISVDSIQFAPFHSAGRVEFSRFICALANSQSSSFVEHFQFQFQFQFYTRRHENRVTRVSHQFASFSRANIGEWKIYAAVLKHVRHSVVLFTRDCEFIPPKIGEAPRHFIDVPFTLNFMHSSDVLACRAAAALVDKRRLSRKISFRVEEGWTHPWEVFFPARQNSREPCRKRILS